MKLGSVARSPLVLLLAAVALLASCKKTEEPSVAEKKPVKVILIEAELPPKLVKPELPPLFDDIERRTFQFFWDTTNEQNGLAVDRYPSRPFASIASIGFALTVYPIGYENGWISREQAVQRTLTTLRFLRDVPVGPQRTGRAGYKGFYYHFLDMQKGLRYDQWVELSSVDTALLMMGVLFAQSYYEGDSADEKEIRQIADTLYRRVDWKWMQQRTPLITMGWYPERGFIQHDWMGYNEGMMVYLLALGSPTHPVEPDAWLEWTRTYNKDWGVYYGQEYLAFGPLFAHQYNHVWIDFRDIQDQYMREHGIDYFLNSRRATLAQREYAIDNPMKWKEYGENVWGLTASDGPQNTTQDYRGEQRQFFHYRTRGAGLFEAFDDGTIAPTAAVSSIVFAPEVVIPATQEMHKRFGDYIYSSYGFLDSFNPSFNYDIPLKTGRMLPNRGWVAGDYIGIDQGAIVTMIANYRNEFVWNVMKKNKYLRTGLERAGFSGGWLTPEGETQPLPKKDEQAATARALGIAESRAASAEAQPNPAQRQQQNSQ
ncbi:glucoamylase family protein [Xanthomonas sp. SI]|uniref:glucoamylase family protein n=1 Tax=Xanthomonas sp. SI TaxID=2724123 RepID=UPI00163B6070|nr:glucoamylase family protein [Xanthomonas sp. SI]QNH12552.1 Putative glucoamylase [Xanthomonas sp. SI]